MTGPQRRRNLPIRLILLLFSGRRFAVDKEVFCAEKSDAIRAGSAYRFSISSLLDVRRNENAMIVQGYGRLRQRIAELLLQCDLLANQLTILE